MEALMPNTEDDQHSCLSYRTSAVSKVNLPKLGEFFVFVFLFSFLLGFLLGSWPARFSSGVTVEAEAGGCFETTVNLLPLKKLHQGRHSTLQAGVAGAIVGVDSCRFVAPFDATS